MLVILLIEVFIVRAKVQYSKPRLKICLFRRVDMLCSLFLPIGSAAYLFLPYL